METEELRHRLLGVTATAAGYCVTVENAAESERKDFIAQMLQFLPKLYLEFIDLSFEKDDNEESDDLIALSEENDDEVPYYGSYVDEDYYDSVRRHIEELLGPDDIFLETFEEDMKYSDTPIASSISECLADIFQPLYNFISIVKESEGTELEGAYRECRENFVSYWGQTLCNVLRALNHLYFSPHHDED